MSRLCNATWTRLQCGHPSAVKMVMRPIKKMARMYLTVMSVCLSVCLSVDEEYEMAMMKETMMNEE